MLFYIFLVAVLNICLGFGVAVHLGRRRRPAPEQEESGGVDAAFGATDSAGSFAVEETEGETGDFVEGGAGREADASEREKSPSQECVETLQAEVEVYDQRLKGVDGDLRRQMELLDEAAIESTLASLMGAIQEYTGGRDAAQEHFGELHDGQPEYAQIDAKLREAIDEQDEHITETCTTVEAFDLEGDLESGCREVVVQTGTLMGDNDALRGTLDEAMVQVARDEQWLGLGGATAQKSGRAGVPGRMDWEASLAKWWKEGAGLTCVERPLGHGR